jgi:hypothetical protein
LSTTAVRRYSGTWSVVPVDHSYDSAFGRDCGGSRDVGSTSIDRHFPSKDSIIVDLFSFPMFEISHLNYGDCNCDSIFPIIISSLEIALSIFKKGN